MERVEGLSHAIWECKHVVWIQNFWARGSFVSTGGADEKTIRNYIRSQETEDRRLDQLSMFEE